MRLKFEGSFLKQEDKAPFTPNNAVNLFIVSESGRQFQDLNTDFTLNDFFFRAVKITKNANPDNGIYTGYDTGLNTRSEFSLLDDSMRKNAIIFWVDMISSVYINDRKK